MAPEQNWRDTCYGRDGNINVNAYLCRPDMSRDDPEGAYDACCPLGHVCLSSGICTDDYNPSYSSWTIEGCSFPYWIHWNETVCPPQICLDRGESGGLEECTRSTSTSDGTYCCTKDKAKQRQECCHGEPGPFQLNVGSPVWKIPSEVPAGQERTSATAHGTFITTGDGGSMVTLNYDPASSGSAATVSPLTTDSITRIVTADGQTSTIVSVSVFTPESASSTAALTGASHSHHTTTIIGVSIAVPIGLVALALLLYILRRHRKNKANSTPAVYFPPDPIDPAATRIYPKVELDGTPKVIAELDGENEPVELEGSPVAPLSPSNRSPQVSELHGSPSVVSEFSNRYSATTAVDRGRWSAVSSLPQSLNYSTSAATRTTATSSTAAGAPPAADLLAIGQQHYGNTGKRNSPDQQNQEALHTSSSDRSPVMETKGSESSSTPKSNTRVSSKQDEREDDLPL